MRLIQVRSIADQVEDLLRERIRGGEYAPGSRIPSESDLSNELGVSRATVRTVLAKLAVNGLIIRKQGDGTYVNARVQQISASLGNVWDFVCLIESNGFAPSIKFLSSETRPANSQEAQTLAIEPGDRLLSLKRLFYADDIPVIYADNVFPISLLQVPVESVDGNLHIREILQTCFKQEIAFVITNVHTARVEKEVMNMMSDRPDTLMLGLDVSFYGKDSTPLAVGANYFDDNVLQLSLVQAWN